MKWNSSSSETAHLGHSCLNHTITLDRAHHGLLLALGLAASGVLPVEALNLAPRGQAVLGVNNAIDVDAGTPRFNAGALANINDEQPDTHVDTWFGNAGTDRGQGISFVGIVWTIPRVETIDSLVLTLATFGDGGWFGVNGRGPAAGEALTAADLLEPTVQTTKDGGATWTTVPHSSDYLGVMTGFSIGGGANPTPNPVTATFTLSPGVSGINGIRIIGQNGGVADGNGFIGVSELVVEAGSAVDADGDGLTDQEESVVYRTNPAVMDSDSDTVSDFDEVRRGSDPNSAGSLPDTLAAQGNGILGTKLTLEPGPETEVPLFHAGTPGNINDGQLTTSVDTYNDAGASTVSFVGIVWESPLPTPVARLELTLATFLDGGWFGVNNQGPAPGGSLVASDLVEPSVEVSSDGGLSWTPVPATSDYVSVLTGHGIGGGGNPNPSSVTARFTLATPVEGITGIRLIGTDGGVASAGFLGVFELTPRAPAIDSDNDGMEDVWERINGLVVGINDAGNDADGDGLPNGQEFVRLTGPQTGDSDGDGLKDGLEITQYQSDPRRVDTDADGLRDGDEVLVYQTDPTLDDSDGDGFDDGIEVGLESDPANPSSVPDNIASLGTGILGTKPALEDGPETELPLFHAGTAASINDANLTSSVDTFDGTPARAVSFVGILWDRPITNTVLSLDLHLAIFFDGGWFGVNGTGPGAGQVLSAADHLLEPILETTTDGGITWTAIGASSDYLEALDQHPLPAVAFGAPTRAMATFRPAQPLSGINGLRIVGNDGGTAGGGFLGVFELVVHAGTSVGPQAVTLVEPEVVGGSMRFGFESRAGANYVVQYRMSLAEGDWQTLGSVVGDGSRKVVTDGSGEAQRYYRVMSE
ncbi:MAG: hypothetical protein JNN07_16975 [Verrucomicrobiales bacterium]|nr:hypothetical protein [Verrucomicrobiales bacterium]